jgi:uncharacterized protein YidB (DUF937 family)
MGFGTANAKEPTMKKRTKIAAGAGAALAIAGAGAAVAADRMTPRAESQAVLNDAAKQLGVDPAKLSDALEQALKNRVDDLVDGGHLTKEQGDALKQRIESSDLPLLAAPAFVRPHDFGPGRFFHHRGAHLDAAASYLGLDAAKLRTALGEGKSLADIAKQQGKSVDGLVDALVAAEKEELEKAVADGRLTDAQRDRVVSTLEERITDFVNGVRPTFGFRGRGPMILPFGMPPRGRLGDA